MPRQSAPIIIRNYQSKDLKYCRNLWRELTLWHREIYHEPSIGGARPELAFDKHLRKVGRTNLWVATRKERVIGFAGLIRSGKDGEIEPVIVTHNQRNTRVGQLLVETIETVARHEKLRELTVRPVARNTSAIRFFHSLGFNTLGHIQLIMDLRENRTVWKKGPKLFQKSFRY